MNKRKISLEVNGKEIKFSVDLAKHNEFVNGYTPMNKTQPSNNFIMQCCDEESKEYLRSLVTGDAGGAVGVNIADALNSAYTPQVEITIKKPVTTQTESSETT